MKTTREEIKKILLELVYDSDAKPRFVNGNLSEKIQYIYDTADKLHSMIEGDNELNNAKRYLSGDHTDEEILQMINDIKEEAKNDGDLLIDYVGEVSVIESLEFRITCNEFLNLIA